MTASDRAAPPADPPERVGLRRRRAWAEAAGLAALTALAGMSFASAFDPRGLVGPVVVAAGAAVGLSWLTVPDGSEAGRWWPARWLAANAAGFVVAAMVVERTVRPWAALDGLVHGWADLLSSAVPVDADGSVLVVPLAVTWATGMAGVLALRRTRSAVLPVLPAVLAVAVGTAFGSEALAGRFGPLATAALAAIGLVVVHLRTAAPPAPDLHPDHSPTSPAPATGMRRAALVGVLAVVVAAAAVTISPHLPLVNSRPPYLLREHYQVGGTPRPAVNPLSLLAAAERSSAAATAKGEQPTTAFTAAGETPVERYPLVVLDRYDGTQWTSAATFLRAGQTLAPDEPLTLDTRSVHQHLVLRDVPGYWIPTPGRPVGVHSAGTQGSGAQGSGVLVDPTTGMLATSGGSTAGLELDIDSELPDYSADALRDARLPDPDRSAPFREVPANVPDSVREVARQATEGADTPLRRAFQIQEHLKQNQRRLPADQATPGSSIGRLTPFLTDPQHNQGSPEQFAAAYALLARLDGLPARVVVGYRTTAGGGSDNVTVQELTAWPEVLFDGFGWVPFDPLPVAADQATATPQAQAAATPVPAVGDVVAQAATTEAGADQAEGAATAEGEPEAGAGAVASLIRWLVGALAAGVAIVVVLLAVGALRRRRRRAARRQPPSSRARVVGAWDEAVDRMAESGIEVSDAVSATELGRRGDELIGAENFVPCGSLARLANTARFGPEPPSAEEVERAWRLADDIRRRLGSHLTRGQRARTLLDPRAPVPEHRRPIAASPPSR